VLSIPTVEVSDTTGDAMKYKCLLTKKISAAKTTFNIKEKSHKGDVAFNL